MTFQWMVSVCLVHTFQLYLCGSHDRLFVNTKVGAKSNGSAAQQQSLICSTDSIL